MATFHTATRPEDLVQLNVFCPACPWEGKAAEAVCPSKGVITCPDCGECVLMYPEGQLFPSAYADGYRRGYQEEKVVLDTILGDDVKPD